MALGNSGRGAAGSRQGTARLDKVQFMDHFHEALSEWVKKVVG